MKLLLDTHAFIWWDGDKRRLSKTALAACLDPANTRSVSIASLWEMQIKINSGKLTPRSPLPVILAEQQGNRMRVELVEVADVLGLAELPLLHRDPFDRMLVVQARRGGFHLVTCDPLITGYDVPVLW